MFPNLTANITSAVTRFASPEGCAGGFFGLRPWHHYIPDDRFGTGADRCEIERFNVLGSNSDFIFILLAVIDDLLRVAGMVAVVFVMYGGFLYITSRGEPDRAASGRKTIINAVVGLVLSLVAVAIVSFIGERLG